jgi:hypothetical protein
MPGVIGDWLDSSSTGFFSTILSVPINPRVFEGCIPLKMFYSSIELNDCATEKLNLFPKFKGAVD